MSLLSQKFSLSPTFLSLSIHPQRKNQSLRERTKSENAFGTVVTRMQDLLQRITRNLLQNWPHLDQLFPEQRGYFGNFELKTHQIWKQARSLKIKALPCLRLERNGWAQKPKAMLTILKRKIQSLSNDSLSPLNIFI